MSDLTKPRSIVLIDDNFVIREVIKIFLAKIRRKNHLLYNIYTSSNGMEGLGLVIATAPAVIILDSTLPKYSGRELLEFLTTNPKFQDSKTKIIVIYEGKRKPEIPDSYLLLNKKDPKFLMRLLNVIAREIGVTIPKKKGFNVKDLRQLGRNIVFHLGNQALKWSNRGTIISEKMQHCRILEKVVRYLVFLAFQNTANIYLAAMFALCGRKKESNLDQSRLDLSQYRVRYYPTLITLFAFYTNILVQSLLLFAGGVAMFGFRVESMLALANYDNTVEVALADSSFDPETITVSNGEVQLLLLDPEEEEETEDILEEPVDEDVVIDEESVVDEIDLPETPPPPNPTEEPAIPDPEVDDFPEDNLPYEESENPDENEVLGAEDSTTAEDRLVQRPAIQYTTEKPIVTFHQKIKYTKLRAIYEESSINTQESSVLTDNQTPASWGSNLITYQLSSNNTDWYFFVGQDRWELTDRNWTNSNTIQEINQGLHLFNTDAGENTLYIRAFMHSDGYTQITLKNLTVDRDLHIVTKIDEIPQEIELPESSPVDREKLMDSMTPVVLNAGYANGQKVIGGRLDLSEITAISKKDLEKLKVHVYFTDSQDTKSPATNKGALIGTSNVYLINIHGYEQYVFELRENAIPGGYVTAEIEYESEKVEDEIIEEAVVTNEGEDSVEGKELTETTGEELATPPVQKSTLSNPVANSTFTATETGDQSDANPGDGMCDHDAGTPGAQCTLRAGIEEANSQSGEDEIEFSILDTDTNCLSFADNGATGYDPDNTEVNCLAGNADPDLKWWRITPSTELPGINRDALIEANTQSGYVQNTNIYPDMLNGQPVVELTCTGLQNCLLVNHSMADVGMNGLVINSATDTNVKSVNSGSGGPFLYNSYIGTDISGTKQKGNTNYGVEVLDGEGAVSGWQEVRNLIVGNTASIYIHSSNDYSYFRVRESILGMLNNGQVVSSDACIIIEGNSDLQLSHNIIAGGTVHGGIHFKGILPFFLIDNLIHSNKYGVYMEGTASSYIADNTIRDNTEGGIVQLQNDNPVIIFPNSIYNNGGLGIDLGNDGVTPNDNLDGDTGPNNLQNYPVLQSFALSGSDTEIYGTFNSLPNSHFKLQFFSNTAFDNSTYGEGEHYLGSANISTDASGDYDFSSTPVTLSGVTPPVDQKFVTSTATLCTDAGCTGFTETSEFGNAVDDTDVLTVNSTGDSNDTNTGDEMCYTGNLNSEGYPECTLRAAIEESNISGIVAQIEFDIPNTDAECLSFEDNGETGYDPDNTEVNCLAGNADPDLKWWRITPATELPDITDDADFHANAQSGYVGNSNYFPDPLNGQPVIEISCSGLSTCLSITGYSADVSLHGFVFNSATTANINANGARYGGPYIFGDYIGTDISGTIKKGNTDYGVRIHDSEMWMGTYSARPITSRSIVVADTYPVYADTSLTGFSSVEIDENYIGTLNNGQVVYSDAAIAFQGRVEMYIVNNLIKGGSLYGGVYGIDTIDTEFSSLLLGNNIISDNKYGIYLETIPETVFGLFPSGAGLNIITGNTSGGIYIVDGTEPFVITNNSIYNNGGLGIDLNDDGVTSNDNRDGDTGPNNLQNYPILKSFEINGSDTEIYGLFNSLPNSHFKLEFFSNTAFDDSTFGEGEHYLDSANISTDANGDYYFRSTPIILSGVTPPVDQKFITATATLCTDAGCTDFTDTSEFSNAVDVDTLYINSTGDSNDTNAGDGLCYTGNLNSEGYPECTLRAAIEEANRQSRTDNLEFSIPNTDIECLSFEDNGTTGYDPDNTEVNCLAGNADPDLKWWRITPATELPEINRDTVIQADTQPGYVQNTNVHPDMLNGQPVVELTCTGLQYCICVTDYGSDVLVNAFVINSAINSNVLSRNSHSGGPSLRNSYIGTDISGTRQKGSTNYGLEVLDANGEIWSRTLIIGIVAPVYSHTSGDFNRIDVINSIVGMLNNGQVIPSEAGIIIDGESEVRLLRNIITGGTVYGGINVKSTIGQIWASLTTSDNLIHSNKYGIYLEGTPANGWETSDISKNTIRDNTDGGIVQLQDDNPISILQNQIYNNGGLGIDLNDDGVTPNDNLDGDTGPNNLQNYPLLKSFEISGSDTEIYGTFNSLPNSHFSLEFFSNTAIDDSTFGEGEHYLGSANISTNASGDYDFSSTPVTFSGITPPADQKFITSTATLCTNTSCTEFTETSEFSNTVDVDTIYINSTGDSNDTNTGDGLCYTGNLNSEGHPECTLRAAIEEANVLNGSNLIEFDIPEDDPKCLSFTNDNTTNTYDPTAVEVNCLAGIADPDLKWWRITPSTELPAIIENLTIDGRTQNGYKANTNPPPDILNGQPVMEIECSGLDTCIIAHFGGNPSILLTSLNIYGLVINSTDFYNTFVSSDQFLFAGNYIGTDISGTIYKPGTNWGLYIWDGDDVTVGGRLPSERNLIVADSFALFGQDPSEENGFKVYGNIIGQLNDGVTVIDSMIGIGIDHDPGSNIGDGSVEGMNIISGGNSHGGISIWSTGNKTKIRGNLINNNVNGITLYSTNNGQITDNTIQNNSSHGISCNVTCENYNIQDNVISNNNGSGINFKDGTGNSFSQNLIYNNSFEIDLGDDGITDNDQGDTDTGPNNLQNYPEITDVEYIGSSQYRIIGDLDGNNIESPFTIEICESDNNSSGHGGCILSLGTTTASSPWETIVTIPGDNGTEGRIFTALATNSNGSTSEFSSNTDSNGIVIIEYPIELIYPIGGLEIDDTTPQLDWNHSQADGYINPELHKYQIYLDDNLYTTVSSDTTEILITESLSLGSHEWQILAVDETDTVVGRSIIETFIIDDSEPTPSDIPEEYTFELIYPVDVTIDDTTPLFDWTDISSASGTEYYSIYINNTLIPTVLDVDISTFQLPDKSSLDEGTHTWYVTATRTDEMEGDILIFQTDTATFEISIPEILPETSTEDPTGPPPSDIIPIKIGDMITTGSLGTAVIVTPIMYGILPLDSPALLLYLFDKLLILLGFRKKGSRWGVVYNSISKHPVRLATIRLFQNGKLLETKVTGQNGQFEFEKGEGTYTMKVQHRNFTFPSKIITGNIDDTYRNIYKGGNYEVKSDKTFIEVSIPVDPAGLSPIQLKLKRITSTIKTILVLINPFILTAGMVLMLRTFYSTGNLLTLSIAIINAIFICLYFYALYRERARWGVVVDKNGNRVENIKIGLYDKVYGNLVATRVTDKQGRYSFLVPSNVYRISVLDKKYVINDEKNIQGYIVGKKGKRGIFAVAKIMVRRISI